MKRFVVLICFFLTRLCALGQVGDTGVDTAIIKLFGNDTAFTGHAEMRVLDSTGAEIMEFPMDFALLDNRLRVEVNMDQMRGPRVTPEAIAKLRRMGVERVASVIRLDKKLHYVIYPTSRAYVNTPMSKDEAEIADKNLLVQKDPIKSEKIDTHNCQLNRVTITGPHGIIMQALTWNAPDLKNFPIQIETGEHGRASVIRFSDVQFAKPDTELFEAPKDFKRYKDPKAFMDAVEKKAGH